MECTGGCEVILCLDAAGPGPLCARVLKDLRQDLAETLEMRCMTAVTSAEARPFRFHPLLYLVLPLAP